MLGRIKDISFYVMIGAALWGFNKAIHSDFIITFLKKDLITILIALLAINATTSGLILTGLKSIVERHACDFSLTIKELKASITEQLAFIIIAVAVMSVMESTWYRSTSDYVNYIFEVSLTSVFVAALSNLYDTASAIFILVDQDNTPSS
ncbi:MAG: hypothetical protein CVU66_00575 [Deltaproteobacteria bacterium HGW-Deltaproteobacteria-23]|nr:MAG: hypothetical protein CVU66_00575 [Deltaproteobacteria bacterium HGW-Deltaproteobacteria-23]